MSWHKGKSDKARKISLRVKSPVAKVGGFFLPLEKGLFIFKVEEKVLI